MLKSSEIQTRLSEAKSFEQAAGIIFDAIMTQSDRAIGEWDSYEAKRLTKALEILLQESFSGINKVILEMRWSNLEDYADAIERNDYNLISF